ncbi:D-cysteine desulfhydrase 2, mitochondrial isoform X2 [Ricinus communis]|uniref:D-cysteine desulfhydrase 2, mitochondrial isoform X2 n=1 Tax=Ricinus communis TaxID=3988 RepID=UPI000772BE23|nr:D-cysteine desulfhydrase 2, mitochondrial isoform X2 [Ricinus communis]|eukprot:XP_015572199.1 D-cysteine desulfhydrase 2, mitochondrial isoform X2 [Ricinus communis]
MKLQRWSCKTAITSMKCSYHSGSQGLSEVKLSSEKLMSNLLNRKWMLQLPNTEIHQIRLSLAQGLHREGLFGDMSFLNDSHPFFGDHMMKKDSRHPSFYIVRDDLLHPLVNGNKARKLDGLIPLLVNHSVTDVVTCGGCQSAHAAAVAVSCAEIGLKSHLLLRGEQPEVLTGYNLISSVYGKVTYVPRHLYAHRESMLKIHADLVAGNNGQVLWCNDILETIFTSQTYSSLDMRTMDACKNVENHSKRVLIVNEGAGDVVALLGAIRLVEYLCQSHLFGKKRRVKLIVDAGTGTTAIGLGLGALCLGVPWEVTAVVLVDTIDAFKQREKCLVSNFRTRFGFNLIDHCLNEVNTGVVHWVERNRKRKYVIAYCQCLIDLYSI